jgi:hypothetical protein
MDLIEYNCRMTQDLRYPIGPEPPMARVTPDARHEQISIIAGLPQNVRAAVEGLTREQLDTPYRPEGWTVRQVVHHLADSHLNGYVRVKLALTEQGPTIKPYDEAQWALLADSRMPLEPSLAILDGLHQRWAAIYRAMREEDFARTFAHPERAERLTLDHHLHIYAWHSQHHVAHITSLRRRQRW